MIRLDDWQLIQDFPVADGKAAPMLGRNEPKVFISSTFKDVVEDTLVDLALRRHIIDDAKALPVEVLAYEIAPPDDPLAASDDADEIIDRCFRQIDQCDLFVFLQTGRHGTGVPYIDDPTLSTYLELELFAAAILRKQILVLHLRDREPPPALRDSMLLLQRAFSRAAYCIDDEGGLRRHFRSACQRLAAGTSAGMGGEICTQLPDWLSIRRSQRTIRRDLANPALFFLGGHSSLANKRADLAKAEKLLDQVGSGVRQHATSSRVMPHGAALFRLWAAFRELMDERGTTRGDPLAGSLWDRGLGLWASKASWFGLHGHLWMGPLAAINSQTLLRQEFAGEPAFRAARDVREPLGARASALYSIAQKLHSPARKVFHYKEVEKLATQAIELDPGGGQGALSIRAHAALRLAMLRRYWKIWDAEIDFRKCLKLRERSGAAPPQIGESKVDLGFLLAHTLRSRKGFALMDDGIALMRSDTSANGLSFLVRGLRKYSAAAEHHGDDARAEGARREIESLANVVEAFDQKRPAQ